MMSLSRISKIVGGELKGSDCFIDTIIDSPYQNGENSLLFFTANTESVSAVGLAEKNKVTALLLDKAISTFVPTILVPDVIKALDKLAQYRRAQVSIPIVGITGSCGKTSTRFLLNKILEQKFSLLTNKDNLNDRVGVPCTLINLHDQHKVAVIEMGVVYPGDIAHLSSLVKPQVAIITNAAAVHLDSLKSIEGVAVEKGEILNNLTPKGVAILNKDDRYFSYWKKIAGQHPIITFGLKKKADVTAKNIVLDNKAYPSFDLIIADQQISIKLQLMGEHQICNAIAASAAAFILNCSLQEIKKGLETAKPIGRRLIRYPGHNGATIIDDSFSAAPDAVLAAIKVLALHKGEKILVLANMTISKTQREIKWHQLIGNAAKKAGIDKLYGLGELCKYSVQAFNTGGIHFMEKSRLIEALKPKLTSKSTVLVKGGHYMGMDEVVIALIA